MVCLRFAAEAAFLMFRLAAVLCFGVAMFLCLDRLRRGFRLESLRLGTARASILGCAAATSSAADADGGVAGGFDS